MHPPIVATTPTPTASPHGQNGNQARTPRHRNGHVAVKDSTKLQHRINNSSSSSSPAASVGRQLPGGRGGRRRSGRSISSFGGRQMILYTLIFSFGFSFGHYFASIRFYLLLDDKNMKVDDNSPSTTIGISPEIIESAVQKANATATSTTTTTKLSVKQQRERRKRERMERMQQIRNGWMSSSSSESSSTETTKTTAQTKPDKLSARTKIFLQARADNNKNEFFFPAPILSSNNGTTTIGDDGSSNNNNNNHTMVILVLSSRGNVLRRQAIRDTWASSPERQQHQVFFLVSEECWVPHELRIPTVSDFRLECTGPRGWNTTFEALVRDTTNRLIREQRQFRDLVWVPRPESYRALVHKVKYGFHWALQHFPNVQWIVKSDDDMMVRIHELEGFLNQVLMVHQKNQTKKQKTSKRFPDGSTLPSIPRIIVGSIQYESLVGKSGKWKEINAWTKKKYPPWPRGASGYAVSRSVAQFVAEGMETLTDFQGEDTSLGIWIEQNYTMKSSTSFVDASHSFTYQGDCFHPHHYMIGHDLSEERIRQCQDYWDVFETINLTWVDPAVVAGSVVRNGTTETPSVEAPSQVAVLVMSERDHFHERQMIRETWGSSPRSNVFFVINDHCKIPPYRRKFIEGVELNERKCRPETKDDLEWNDEAEQFYVSRANSTWSGLLYEQYRNQDLLFVREMRERQLEAEAYTLKKAYRWILHIVPNVTWIIKVNDQSYVRMDKLETYLNDYAIEEQLVLDYPSLNDNNSSSSNTMVVVGEIVNQSQVWKKGPWADPTYPKDIYPFWPKGSCGQIVSRAVAEFVEKHFDELEHYQGSDTSLGIWLDEVAKAKYGHSIRWKDDMDHFQNINDCAKPKPLIMGYQLSPPAIHTCWDDDEDRAKADNERNEPSSSAIALTNLANKIVSTIIPTGGQGRMR